MATTKQILEQQFTLIKKELIEKHIELGMKASGKWINELEVESTNEMGRIIGMHYTKQLVSGRKAYPGDRSKTPPIEAIKQWIKDKGISSRVKGEAGITSFAWAIARTIQQKGTRYFQQGGTDLIDAVITPARMQKVINLVGKELTYTLVTKVENEFKKMTA